MVALLTAHLRLPGCSSLKEKRGRLKPLLHRLRREFNLSTAELDLQDDWDQALIGCAMLGNDAAHLRSALETVRAWLESHWSDGDIIATHIEVTSL